ncbi:MAG: PD-(D/E)XK nuclease family protein [Lachnospiraceae bacterium]|nr:PD-(D/E)XK nuclease family protein [Lachnospiraceae bacterium]
MLKLILGASGTGKSHMLFSGVIEEADKDRKRNFLIVVPEQFTLHAQKEIIEKSPVHGFMNIDILSFPRLAHRVFEELGYTPPVILEDTGKTMIVKKVALDNSDRLGIFAGKVHRQGFIEQMKSVIAEFYQYSIGPEELEDMMEKAGNRSQLRAKLKDIDVIYRGFREFIRDRFIMNEELLEIFAEKIEESRILKGCDIVFDGFTGFTVMQLKCIEKLLSVSANVCVSITGDPEVIGTGSTGDSLFDLSRITFEKLIDIAGRTGQETKVLTVGDTAADGDIQSAGSTAADRDIQKAGNAAADRDIQKADNIISGAAGKAQPAGIPYRFIKNPALASLEHNIFRHPIKKSSDHRGISLASCESPTEEVRFVVGCIRRLTALEDYRYGDIAVITGDLENYEGIAVREFTRAGIPCFADSKRSIIGTAPVELLRSVIIAALKGFDTASVLRFAKSAYSGFSAEETAALENYCIAKAVRGAGWWQKEWTKGYKTRYEVDLGRLNELRKRICSCLIEPALRLAGDVTVSERVKILKELMKQLDIERKLEEKEQSGKTSATASDRSEALEAGQLYSKICEVFERIEKLLSGDLVKLREFSEILDTGFSEEKLAMIPQGRDYVMIGDMERTRLGAVRVLFFIGVNDGLVPKSQTEQGLLSIADRMIFEENDIELSPVGLRNAYLKEFYLYLNLTKPSEKLFMTYHRMTADKKPGHRSFIFSEMMKIYPGLEIRDVYRTDDEMLVGSDRGRHTAARAMRDFDLNELDASVRTVCAAIAAADPEEYGMLMKAAFDHKKAGSLTRENAEGLYGRVLKGSVTMLERFASCAYSNFLRYGLKLEERQEFKVGAVELGNIYHKAVELYGTELKKSGKKWHDTDEEIRNRIMEAALDAALTEYDEIVGSTNRNRYIRTRAERVLRRTIGILDHQVKGGSFEPEYFEESFKTADSFMELVGKIDRIDISEKDGKKYVRVIDYKSGRKKFDLIRLYNGLQIQLAVYMNEALVLTGRDFAGGDGTKPGQPADVESAGMYYYNIDDPILEGTPDSTGTEQKILSELKLQGPSADNRSSLKLSDDGLIDEHGEPVGGYDSDIISVKYKVKDGEYDSRSNILSSARLSAAGRYATDLMHLNSGKILNGNVDIDPFEDGNIHACTYCPYNAVCGFDRSLGYRYRKLKKADEEEIWKKIENSETVRRSYYG